MAGTTTSSLSQFAMYIWVGVVGTVIIVAKINSDYDILLRGQKLQSGSANIHIHEDDSHSQSSNAVLRDWGSEENLYNLSGSDLRQFLADREMVYSERRSQIASICRKIENVPHFSEALQNMRTTVDYFMQYITDYHVAYCHIPKVYN